MQHRIFSSLGIALLPILFLSAPFLIYLKSNGVSFWADGFLLSLGLKLSIAYLICALLIFISGIFKGLLIALSLVFFIDYQIKFDELYDLLGAKSDFFDSNRFYWIYAFVCIVIFLVAFYVFIKLKNTHYKALLVIFGAIFVFVIFIPNYKPLELFKDNLSPINDRPKTGHLPPIVTIIMNNHGALDTMPDTIPQVKEAKDQIINFHQKHDLVLFSHGLSQYASSDDAISNLLNFTQDSKKRSFFEGQRKFLSLKQNNYFGYLNDKGYVFNVYQHKEIDFCNPNRGKIARCLTYNDEYPINMMHSLQSASERQDLLMDEFLRSSFLIKNIGKFLNVEFDHLFHSKFSFAYNKKPLNYQSLNLLKELSKDLLEKGDSHVYFAHLNLPQEPFMLKKDCSIRPYSEGWYLTRKDQDIAKSNEILPQKAIFMAEQMQCVYKTLDDILESWKTKGIYDDVTLIIQGDKGFSLNSSKYQLELDPAKASVRDQDLYATHFAYHKEPAKFGTTDAVYLASDIFSGLTKLHPFTEEKEPNVFAKSKENPEILQKRPYMGKKTQ